MTEAAEFQKLVDAEADAEGAVRVAELQLAEVRQDGSSESALAAAEEQLAAAQRQLQRCRNATVLHGDADYSDRIAGRADQPMQYSSAAEWLQGYLLRQWRRQNVRWCAQWYLHAEAVTRIQALWKSWEDMRWAGPTGMATWWLSYLDPHMRELTGPTGPFEFCNAKTGEHQEIDQLKVRQGAGSALHRAAGITVEGGQRN